MPEQINIKVRTRWKIAHVEVVYGTKELQLSFEVGQGPMAINPVFIKEQALDAAEVQRATDAVIRAIAILD